MSNIVLKLLISVSWWSYRLDSSQAGLTSFQCKLQNRTEGRGGDNLELRTLELANFGCFRQEAVKSLAIYFDIMLATIREYFLNVKVNI